ncbi:MAG TPA: ABC transporter permease, partial [Candidatus Binatia bacterium]|nr:ABC transporter permease [Candidatus Binatia bacterium]
MSGLLQDLRYALRQFRKSPGFAAGAILSLALGIGAATTLFSVVYGVLLDPFPYKDAKHIAYAGLLNASGHYSPLFVAGGHWGDVLSATAVVEVLFQQPDAYRNLTGESIPLTVHAGVLSPGAFHFLGVPALVGRAFTTADAPGGNPAPLAVLSHRFWMEHYLGNRSVIGKTLELDHTPYTVIGVMPPRFVWFGSDVYLPGKPSADPHEFWMTFLRLKPGTARLAAEAEMQALVNGFAKEDPESYGKSPRVKILSLHEEWLGESRGTLAALFAAALLLLLIGCANISILLLARGAARQQEFAVRTSLGAGRGRLIRQLLTESIVISTGGAALGALAAWWGVHATPGILPDELLPQEVAIQMNLPVLLFSAASAALTGILFGLSPALEFSRPRAGRVLQGGGAQTADRSRARTMHRLPIAGQVA